MGFESVTEPPTRRYSPVPPPYRRIAVLGLLAAGLAAILGFRIRVLLIETYGLAPEPPAVRAAWLVERALEFIECAGNVRTTLPGGRERLFIVAPGSRRSLDPEQTNCIEIALRIAQEAIQLDPDRAETHFLVARARGCLGADDEVVLASLDRAVALDPSLREARVYRAHLLTSGYMDRWERLEARLLLGEAVLRCDAELANLRERILADMPPDDLSSVWPEDVDVALLDVVRKALQGRGETPLRLPVVDWAALADEGHPWSERHFRFKRVSLMNPSAVRCDLEDRVLRHGRVVAWEADWWYSRWPSYGPRRDLSTLAEYRAQEGDWPVFEGDWALRQSGAKWVQELARKAPGDGLAFAREAQALEALGLFGEALECADRAVAALPDAPGLHLLRARIREDLYDLDEARADYDDAVRLGEGRAEFLRVRAAYLLQTGHPEEALRDARHALEIENSPTSLALVGDALAACGRAEEALSVLCDGWHPIGAARCRALRSLGRREEAAKEAARIQDPIEIALSTLALGDTRSAKSALTPQDDPGSRPSRQYAAPRERFARLDRGAFAEARARVMLALGQDTAALAEIDNAIRDQPMRATAHALRARILLELVQPHLAGEATRRAVEINPRCPLAWKTHGRVLEAQGRLEAAEEAYEKAMTLDERDSEAKALLSGLRARMKQ